MSQALPSSRCSAVEVSRRGEEVLAWRSRKGWQGYGGGRKDTMEPDLARSDFATGFEPWELPLAGGRI